MGQTFVTPAVVIRHVDYRESDRIITLFTRDHGRIAGLARGVRRSVKRFSGRLDLFTLVEIQCREGRGLYQLESASLLSTHLGLRNELYRIAWAAYLCEFVEKLFGEGEPHPGAFRALVAALSYLSDAARVEEGIPRAFQLRLLAEAGLQPELEACVSCGRLVGEAARFSYMVTRGGPVCEACAPLEPEHFVAARTLGVLAGSMEQPLDELGVLRFSRHETRQIRDLLTSFVQYHVGAPLKSAGLLAELVIEEEQRRPVQEA